MAEHRRLNCSPEEVFDVLNDGWSYPLWVVGASRIRDVDAGWPGPGSKLHHSFGVWPLLIDDSPQLFWGLVASMYIGNVMLLSLIHI